ncbi:MAG TPA: hydrogenase 2 operon protein HybA [Candidatus Krumholzibacteria bacterium]|nr:hydrogenase 2 operon protein HybA [Candidatus Krumholzibacteria bacterium]HRX52335.1 hydrogenase 2 operon protein HybA [Candidatus Krumholzibacteria bacterium]
MTVKRRDFLRTVIAAGAAAAVPAAAEASGTKHAPEDAVGMLYDATRCIGCKACVVACKQANDMPADTRLDPLHDMPMNLNDRTRNIIKLYEEDEKRSYVKRQCMHCIDPSCVGACMIGALDKREHGIVTWDGNLCIGCRYCHVACPYDIPKFEWDKRVPKVVKCELCNHRIADGGEPACCEVCPREAVIYGRHKDLLAEAHRRIEASPGRYIDHVYGEHEGGGTQVLYLSHVPFEDLGLPALEDKPASQLTREVQHGIYKGFVAPVALYGVLGVVMMRNKRMNEKKENGEGGH